MAGLTEAKGSSLSLDDVLLSTADGEGASKVNTRAAGSFGGISVEAALESLISSHFLSTVTIKTTNYTQLVGERNTFYDMSGTSLLSLIPVATAGEGFAFVVKNSGVAVVTIGPDGTDTINGAATLVLAAGDWAIITCDVSATNWVALVYVLPAGATDLSTYVKKTVDPFLQSYGDGSDGAFNSVGASTLSEILSNHTTFALNAGHVLTIDIPICIIRATTSISIVGNINARGADIAAGAGASLISLGTSPCSSCGGGGGGGAGYNTLGANNNDIPGDPGNSGDSNYFVPGGIGGARGKYLVAAAAGSNGSVPTASQKSLIISLFSQLIGRGGGKGGNGGRGGHDINGSNDITVAPDGAIGGFAGSLIILIAPTITIDVASTIDVSGQVGANGANASLYGGSGGGGGGAGGTVLRITPTLTDNGTTTITGGTGGNGGTASFGSAGAAGGDGADGYIYTIDPTV